MNRVIEESGINAEAIVGIGIAGQGCGFYATDKGGNDIRNAITSADNRAFPQVTRWMEEGLNRKLYSITYREPSPGCLCSILAWLKENEKSSYAKIDSLFSMKDFLVYKMTGKKIAGYGCQSASGLMDMRTGMFTSEFSKALAWHSSLNSLHHLEMLALDTPYSAVILL